jgi:hypothetical protein
MEDWVTTREGKDVENHILQPAIVGKVCRDNLIIDNM